MFSQANRPDFIATNNIWFYLLIGFYVCFWCPSSYVYMKAYEYQSSVNFFSLFSIAFQSISDIYTCFLQWWRVPRLWYVWSFLVLPSAFILLCVSPTKTKQVSLGAGNRSWNPSQPDHVSLLGSSPSALVALSFCSVCLQTLEDLKAWKMSSFRRVLLV